MAQFANDRKIENRTNTENPSLDTSINRLDFQEYIVQKGDNLTTITKKLGGDPRYIRLAKDEHDNLIGNSPIYPDQKIYLLLPLVERPQIFSSAANTSSREIESPNLLEVSAKLTEDQVLKLLRIRQNAIETSSDGKLIANGQRLGNSNYAVWASSGRIGQARNETGLNGLRKEAVVSFYLTTQRILDETGQDIVFKITGGTEAGHSTRGAHNHSSGWKLDIAKDPKIISYMKENGWDTVTRQNKGCIETGYIDPVNGSTWWVENNHIDIALYNAQFVARLKERTIELANRD